MGYLIAIPGIVVHAIALKLLWGWFLIPTLGVPAVSLEQAIGIYLIVACITQRLIPEDDWKNWKLMEYSLMHPLFAIAVGWIVQWLMHGM